MFFRWRQARQLFMVIPAIASIVLLYLLDLNPKYSIGPFKCLYLKLGAMGVLIDLAIITFIGWRCPICNSFLGIKLNPARCNACRTKLHV